MKSLILIAVALSSSSSFALPCMDEFSSSEIQTILESPKLGMDDFSSLTIIGQNEAGNNMYRISLNAGEPGDICQDFVVESLWDRDSMTEPVASRIVIATHLFECE